MSKKYALFLTLLFCLFFGGGLLAHVLTPDRAKSEVENRVLQQVPSFSVDAVLDGSFMEDTEEYIADQFPLRDKWTTVRARSEQAVGKREFHDVFLCDDRLIARVDPATELAQKNLSYVQALSKKTNIPVYLGLIPSAAEIWKDCLPAGGESFDQAAFLARATELGLPMVDYLSALQARRDEDLYYRTDHHWTSLGAYYGYTAVAKAFNFTPVALKEFSPERVTETFNGTLYSTSGVHWLNPDAIDLYVPETALTVTSYRTGKPEPGMLYDRSYLEKKDKYSLFLGGNQPLCVVANPDGAGKLLVVRDSYADALVPFLATSFSEVHLLDLRYYKGSVAQYAAEQGMDTILVSYSVPNFLTDTNLVFLGK